MSERRQQRRALGAPLPGFPEWVIPAQPDQEGPMESPERPSGFSPEIEAKLEEALKVKETPEEAVQREDNLFESERRRVSMELYRIANELRAVGVDPFFSRYQRTTYPVEAATMVTMLAADTMANWRRL